MRIHIRHMHIRHIHAHGMYMHMHTCHMQALPAAGMHLCTSAPKHLGRSPLHLCTSPPRILYPPTPLLLLQRYSTMPTSIFSAFNAEEIKIAASVATFRQLALGQLLYAVGDEPSDFYVVAHGEVMCDYCDGSEPTTLKVGAYFGEVSSK